MPSKRRFALRFRSVLPAAALAGGMLASAALAAIAPWYPREGADSCKVAEGATLRVDTSPSWTSSILGRFGWVGQEPRVYTLPPVLDCRPGSAQEKPGWACEPSFVPWAKKNCAGLKVLE